MKALQLIAGVVALRRHSSMVMPNYTPRNWWECDVFEVMKSGYWYEYEIKVTRGDFLADRKKEKRICEWTKKFRPERAEDMVDGTKHSYLEANDKGPNKFFFVTAKGIVTIDDIPGWAGWYEAREENSNYGKVGVDLRKPAPLRHRVKLSEAESRRFKTCAYYRFMEMWIKKRLD